MNGYFFAIVLFGLPGILLWRAARQMKDGAVKRLSYLISVGLIVLALGALITMAQSVRVTP